MITNAAKYAIDLGGTENITLLIKKTFTGLAYVGGCLIGILFFTPFIWPRRTLFLIIILLFIFTATLMNVDAVKAILIPYEKNHNYTFYIQYVIFVFTGMQIFLLAFIDFWKNRTAESLLLFMWVLGTFFFANYLNWTITARVILPIAPAAGILVMRRFNENSQANYVPKIIIIIFTLIPAAIIALSVAWADTSLANASRTFASIFQEKFKNYPHRIWFQGHWGFQYYMERINAKAFDYSAYLVKPGDLDVIPSNNSNIHQLSKDLFHFVGLINLKPSGWIATMSAKHSAGFYWGLYGPLPFSFGRIDDEEYHIFISGENRELSEVRECLNKKVGTCQF